MCTIPIRRPLAWLLGLVCALSAHAAPEPIRIGSVSTLTGPGSTVAWRAAKAYFEAVNAAGGIGGRRIEYLVLDDRADPQAAQQAGARLAADAGIVALAGGSSVLECALNHAVYESAGLMSIPGAGVDPACFGSPAIAPVNAGPYVSTANALSFAREVLKRERLCVVAPALPGMVDAFRGVVARWAAAVSPLPTEASRTSPRTLFQVFESTPGREQMVDAAAKAVAQLCGATTEADKALDPRLARALTYIRAHIRNSIALGDVAAAVALSESRFRHLFVAETGSSFRAYLLWLRVNLAIEAATAGASWTEAAHGAGTADSAHLTRTYKRVFGIEPSAVRPQTTSGSSGSTS